MRPEPPDDRSEAGWPIGAGRTTSLSDMLAARGPLPPAAAAMVASQVCVALATAHARGLTYGRLTPANVLLSADGRVKLQEFWMAQAARRSTVSDPRDDLHALGRCMVVMLTGREPAAGEPVLLGPEVPTQLAVIVAGAVGDARGGYRSASDLGRDLVRFLTTARPSLALAAGRPAAAGPPRPPGPGAAGGAPRPPVQAGADDEAQRPAGRRRRLALVAGLVGAWLAIVAVVALGLPGGKQERPAVPVEVPATPSSALVVPTTGGPPASGVAPTTSAPTTTALPTVQAMAPPVTVPAPVTSHNGGRVDVQRIVPDVRGLELRKAAEVLGNAQLRVRFVQVRTRWQGDHQRVIAQDPPAGRAVPVDSVVTLAVPSRRGPG